MTASMKSAGWSRGGGAIEGGKAEEGSAAQADLLSLRLKLFAGLALRVATPALSLLALVLAIISLSHQSELAQLDQAMLRIESMNASLSEARSTLENLATSMAHEKIMQDEARQQQDELMARVVQNLSQLQAKLKIAPTLDEQLHPAASAPLASTSVVPATAQSPEVARPQGAHAEVLKAAINEFNKK
jgi:hypothetical protein